MKVVIFGSTQIKHIDSIYRELGWTTKFLADSAGNPWMKLVNIFRILWADTVYRVGGCDYKTIPLLRLAKLLRKKVIIHWIGTDVIVQTEKYRKNPQIINASIINLAVSENLSEELRRIGVESDYVPIVPADIPYPPAPPMPEHHKIMVYLPKGREHFYGWYEVVCLATHFPEIPFNIVAHDGEGLSDYPSNIVFKGSLNHEALMELYQETSLLLRLTEHDGLPVMMLEAQGLGRKVMHYYQFPYVITPDNSSEEGLLKSFGQFISQPPALDMDAKNYVDETFNHTSIAKLYREKGLA